MNAGNWATRRWVGWMCGFVGLCTMAGGPLRAATVDAPADARAPDRRGFSAVVKKAVAAVVAIRVERTIAVQDVMPMGPFGPMVPGNGGLHQLKQEGMGSGFIISKKGYILTNHHVVGDADKIKVKLMDGREFSAKRIGTDPHSEVALIQIEADNLPVLPLGDSSKMEPGDWVIAIGNPFGLMETVTVGVVSAKGRNGMGIADYEDMIQTDASINPGNSGGPLLDVDGNAIGINTAVFSENGSYTGIGFAVPMNMAKAIEEQLIKTGKVVRGHLGLSLQELTSDLASSFGTNQGPGILIAQVQKGAPGDKADLKEGDIITQLNGQPVEGVSWFRSRIALHPPGMELTLTILRDGKEKVVKVTTGTLPDEGAATTSGPGDFLDKLGFTVQDLSKDVAGQMGYKIGEGVVVDNVTANGPADEKGLQPGDLVTSVNKKPVSSVEEFNKALSASKVGQSVLLHVKNDKGVRFVIIAMK